MCPLCSSRVDYEIQQNVADKNINHFVERCMNNFCEYRVAVIEVNEDAIEPDNF